MAASTEPRLTPAYAELRCRSSFSFLQGASQPEELVQRAHAVGLSALALTDRHGLYGLVRAYVEAKELGLRLIVGAELPGDFGDLTFLATSLAGYGRLCRLITAAHHGRPKGESYLSKDAIPTDTSGLQVLYSDTSELRARELKSVFGEHLALWIARHHVAGEEAVIAQLRAVGARQQIPVVVTNDVHYHHRSRQALQDVLTCTRLGTTIHEAGRRLFPNAERVLKSPAEMAELWRDYPEGLELAAEIAARCTFSLGEAIRDHPLPPLADAETPMQQLRRLVEEGAVRRFPQGLPERVRAQTEHELRLIEQLDYASYFLTIWDIVRFARSKDILCQGRGSAANSVVCYLLGVTAIDPVDMGLLFERFISVERGEPPDIDVDFEHERREEVIQYVYEKYGRQHAAMVSEVISYRGRSALRDVAKALAVPEVQVDALAKRLSQWSDASDVTLESWQAAGVDGPEPAVAAHVIRLTRELLGFPRHLGIHVGGFVITRSRLDDMAPIEPATMEGRTVLQWDKDDLAALNLLKVDILALGMLTMLRKTFPMMRQYLPDAPQELATIPPRDEPTFEMLRRADSVGVFQIESRAQMSMLPRLKPRNFYDLVISIAIVRPGPIQGGMVHPFLRRRDGLEPTEYAHPSLRPILEKTLGIVLFQEQAMKLAITAAGFSPGDADQLRRAMTHKRSREKLEAFRTKLFAGMQARGISGEYAEEVHRQLIGFSGYGFPESHSASFALLAYASSWIKCHHPAAMAAALLNSQPMGFYAPHTILEDVKRHGVEVRGIDVNASAWDCTLEGPTPGQPVQPGEVPVIRVGLRYIKGLPEKHGKIVATERPYDSLDQLMRRTRLPRRSAELLASADALRCFGVTRRQALWSVLATEAPGGDDLFAGAIPSADPLVALPVRTRDEEVLADFAETGLSDRAHVMTTVRPRLDRHVLTAADINRARARQRVRTAGLVLVRQRPETASGILFVSLEDETGICNLVVMAETFEKYRQAIVGHDFIEVWGKIERVGMVVHVKVDKAAPLMPQPSLRLPTRDFR